MPCSLSACNPSTSNARSSSPYVPTPNGKKQHTSQNGSNSSFRRAFTAAVSDLREDEGEIDGVSDPLTEFKKQSTALTTAYATSDLRWVFKGTWSHALNGDGNGQNFPTTDIFTVGVSYAFY